MRMVGAHVSIAGGIASAPANARAIGATAFALFLKNPRSYGAKPLVGTEIAAFKEAMSRYGYEAQHVVPHVGYLVNLGSPRQEIAAASLKSFMDEMQRCQALGLRCLNIHPGSFAGGGELDACLRQIASAINRALEKTRGVTVVLENTAGQGSSVGHTFEQLAEIIDRVEDKTRIGVCFDTCHGFAAGYDIRTPSAYQATYRKIEAVIGMQYVRAIHLNDAKAGLGSRLDRHENLGNGELGWEPFRILMSDVRLAHLPMILETPNERLWPLEIAKLMAFAQGTKQRTSRP